MASFDLEPSRWAIVFGLLSLDMTEGHWAAMGLELPRDRDFRLELRSLIERFRANEDPAAPDPGFARAAFQWFAERYGVPAARRLFEWGTQIFQYAGSDGASAFLWRNLIIGHAYPGAAPHTAVRVRDLLLQQRTARIPNSDPGSDWDRRYFERHGFGDEVHPMEWVRSTQAHVRFVKAWTTAGAAADAEEIQRWGVPLAAELGMPGARLGLAAELPLWPDPPKA